jgi:inositol-pentakisphosphate 2-kinase
MKSQMMDCVLQCSYHASPGGEREAVSQVGLTYLAEGAAHIVYRISLPGTAATTHPQLVGRLFRFRKSIPSAVPCAQTVSNFQNRIAPLFPEDSLVDLKLHHLPDPYGVTTKLNTALQQREANGTRPIQRRGIYLAPSSEEPNDILVTDMSPQGPDERLVEFKPKWLVQSPSAPAGARRCRTCALREMRTEDERLTGDNHTGRGHAEFCPLDLLSTDDDVLERVIQLLSLTSEFTRTYVWIFKEHIQPLLLRLRDLQAEYNNVGINNFANGQDQDFSVSMALRDCSLFLKSKTGEVGFQEVRLADLDLKSSGGGKLERWAGIERRLIDEGWYTGTEDADSRGQRFCRVLQGS